MRTIQPNVARHTRVPAFAARLLDWYDRHHRELPWRVSPRARAAGDRPDPYRVWLSEVMLQQTTVETVKPYFRAFTERWPDIASLAAADDDDVLKAWAGLGYYSRARNLIKCAHALALEHGGVFPDTEDGLATLPGVGGYTAAAVAAIAFGRPVAVVDGNVERVIARHAAIETPLPAGKREIKTVVQARTPAERPGDFAQAMMDLGATVCTPRRPACLTCPVSEDCEGLATGDPERLPVKAAKKDKPLRRGAAFVAVRDDGAVLVRKRGGTGLLAGMTEVPTTGWTARIDGDVSTASAPFEVKWQLSGQIVHVFTHFELRLDVYRADVSRQQAPAGYWWSLDPMSEALPTVMKKAIEAAIPGATHRPRFPKGQP